MEDEPVGPGGGPTSKTPVPVTILLGAHEGTSLLDLLLSSARSSTVRGVVGGPPILHPLPNVSYQVVYLVLVCRVGSYWRRGLVPVF